MHQHEDYSLTSLFQGLNAGMLTQARPVLMALLRDYQADAIDYSENDGIRAHITILGGPLGSGKSYTAFVAPIAYTLDIEVPLSTIALQQSE